MVFHIKYIAISVIYFKLFHYYFTIFNHFIQLRKYKIFIKNFIIESALNTFPILIYTRI